MDIFQLRDRVIDQYSQYTQGFLTILDPAIQEFVSNKLQRGSLWPDSLIQLSPAYEQVARLNNWLRRRNSIHYVD